MGLIFKSASGDTDSEFHCFSNDTAGWVVFDITRSLLDERSHICNDLSPADAQKLGELLIQNAEKVEKADKQKRELKSYRVATWHRSQWVESLQCFTTLTAKEAALERCRIIVQDPIYDHMLVRVSDLCDVRYFVYTGHTSSCRTMEEISL